MTYKFDRNQELYHFGAANWIVLMRHFSCHLILRKNSIRIYQVHNTNSVKWIFLTIQISSIKSLALSFLCKILVSLKSDLCKVLVRARSKELGFETLLLSVIVKKSWKRWCSKFFDSDVEASICICLSRYRPKQKSSERLKRFSHSWPQAQIRTYSRTFE